LNGLLEKLSFLEWQANNIQSSPYSRILLYSCILDTGKAFLFLYFKNVFKKNYFFLFFRYFKLIFFVFSDHFDIFISKIIFLKIYIILMYFREKTLLKVITTILANTLIVLMHVLESSISYFLKCFSLGNILFFYF
jgi:hypothetical protein